MGKAESEQSLLANALFARSLLILSKKIITEASMAYDHGNTDLAHSENKKAMLLFSSAILMSPSPNLTTEENIKYIKLMKKRYSINDEGILVKKEINDKDKKVLLNLKSKVYPNIVIGDKDV